MKIAKNENGVSEYESGVKRSEKDVRWDLLSPIGLRRMAEAAHQGSVKYGERNVEKGLPVNVLLNHAVDHIYAYLAGCRKEDHLGHAAWNLHFASHSADQWPHLNQKIDEKK